MLDYNKSKKASYQYWIIALTPKIISKQETIDIKRYYQRYIEVAKRPDLKGQSRYQAWAVIVVSHRRGN